MTDKTTGNSKKGKPGVDESPDKSYYVLNKPLDVCGKCNKKCMPKGEAIQCDLCCMWVHAMCEGIARGINIAKAIKSVSMLDNIVYHCKINKCMYRSL